MQNHPIPQNVTAYEFHIVGNMTLKQFIELGVGIGIAVLFYSTNLHNYVKWPLVGISALGGAAVAFMPFDGRPLDRMILAFFKAVYTPSQFIWKKSAPIPNYFKYTPRPKKASDLDLEKQKLRKNVGEYLSTLPKNSEPSDYDQTELDYINKVNQLFDSTPAAKQVSQGTDTIIAATPQIRVRKIKPLSDLTGTARDISQTIKANSVVNNQVKPTPTPKPQPITQPKQPSFGAHPRSKPLALSDKPLPTKIADQNTQLPFPTPPTTPNTIVGMILDHQGKIVENAIIEIRDKNHLPLRALKTNKLGQFFSVTPLEDGAYEIEVEKDGLSFDLQKLSLKGDVIPPLDIRARPAQRGDGTLSVPAPLNTQATSPTPTTP